MKHQNNYHEEAQELAERFPNVLSLDLDNGDSFYLCFRDNLLVYCYNHYNQITNSHNNAINNEEKTNTHCRYDNILDMTIYIFKTYKKFKHNLRARVLLVELERMRDEKKIC